MKSNHRFAHYSQAMGEIRTYSSPDGYQNRDPFLAIVNVIWITAQQVMLRGGKGEMDARSILAICLSLKQQGVEQLIIKRAKGKRVPWGKLTESDQYEDTYLVELNTIEEKQ